MRRSGGGGGTRANGGPPAPRPDLFDIVNRLGPDEGLPVEVLLQFTNEEIDDAYERCAIEAGARGASAAEEEAAARETAAASAPAYGSMAERIGELPSSNKSSTLQIVDIESASAAPDASNSSSDAQFPIDVLKYRTGALANLSLDNWMERLKKAGWKFNYLRMFDPQWPNAESNPMFIQQLETYVSALQNSSVVPELALEEWKKMVAPRVLRFHHDMHESDRFITLAFLLRTDYFVYFVLEKKKQQQPSASEEAASSGHEKRKEPAKYVYFFHYYTWSDTKVNHTIMTRMQAKK
jgi:hypothetical protein